MRFLGQQPSQVFSRFLHGTAKDNGLRTRKVNVLKYTLSQRLLRSIPLPRHSFGANADHFSRLDVIQVRGIDQVERTRFGRKDIGRTATGKLHLSKGQRTESMRIASDDNAVISQKY